MGAKAVRVEFFFAGGCSKCVEAREALRQVARSARAEWKEIDIAKDPNRAVDAGVVSTPAVTIEGALVFKTMPTAAELRNAIRAREGKR